MSNHSGSKPGNLQSIFSGDFKAGLIIVQPVSQGMLPGIAAVMVVLTLVLTLNLLTIWYAWNRA